MSLVSDLLNYDGAIESVRIYRNAKLLGRDGRKDKYVNLVSVWRANKRIDVTFDLNKSLNSNEVFRKIVSKL